MNVLFIYIYLSKPMTAMYFSVNISRDWLWDVTVISCG